MADTTYNPRTTVEPSQKLSMARKTEDWKKTNVDSFIGKASFGGITGSSRKADMRVAYDLYNGIFDEKDFKHLTDPFKTDESFPATLQNFNIIKPKIDLLKGEETKRPFSFKIVQTNEEATSKMQEKHMELLTQAIVDIALAGDADDPVTDQEIDQVEAISKYMNMDYSDVAEMQAYHTLNYLNEKLDMKTQYLTNFHDLKCGAVEIGYVGAINGEPTYERVNPLHFSGDTTAPTGYIEDGDWAVRRMKMTASAAYDRFYDIMKESDLDELLTKFNANGFSHKGSEGGYGVKWRSMPGTDFFQEGCSDQVIDIYHVVWRSLKKIGFLTYTDDMGIEQEDIVDETYKPLPEEEVVWDWVDEIWEGYRLGDDIYIGMRPIPNQNISLDNPNATNLPYIGNFYGNINTAPRSLVEIMKPLQYFYITIVYQLQLAIARDKGKILTVDVTQIPKSLGIDANKWLHYLSSTNVNFINPYETGWDTPGREGGKPAQFNQFGQADLTMSKVIVDYIQLMTKIEDMIGELSGVSKARQGQIHQSSLVGNTQQEIIQSSHITEHLFYTHNQFKKRVYTALLNTAKAVWANSGKKKLHYLTDDMSRVFMDITDEFIYSDMDIFVSDSTREHQSVEAIRQLAQPAMQNGASLYDISEIMSSNNLTDMKNKLQRIQTTQQQREDDMQRMAQEAQMQQSQMQAQIEQAKEQLEYAKLQQKDGESNRNSQTQVQVALINADSREAIEEAKRNIDFAKLDLESQVKGDEMDFKDTELQEVKRSNISEEAIKRTAAKNKPKTTTTSN